MRTRAVWLMIVAVGALVSGLQRPLLGQDLALAGHRPRFLYAAAKGATPVEIDASRNAVLRRVVSLRVSQPTIGRLLTTIERQTRLTFVYGNTFPAGRPITLQADSITVAAALSAILLDTGTDVVLSPTGYVALVDATPRLPSVEGGTVIGRVTDAKTQAVLTGATVVVQGTSHSATTGNDGRYRIADVAPGTYTVRARYIGYAPGAASVTVSADQEATADFTLEKSAQQLNEVVTTGTVVPTEVKALPTPVSVINERDIALQRPHSVQELFRQAVPTAVSWDYAAYPDETSLSVRGASTLNGGNGQMKVFVDGIEAANPTFAPIDPNSIDRIEVIRGPQAAAIYGSDAIGGVIQVFTKRGDPNLIRPQVDAQAAYGIIQTPYAGYGGVLRQTYGASIRGGGADVSYNLGAGYAHTADWVQPVSAQSNPSVYGGVHLARGIMTIDVSGRYYTQNNPQIFNPELVQTGYAYLSKPLYQQNQYQNQMLGARISMAPTGWWQQTVTVGFDHRSADGTQTQPRLTNPADTLLSAFNSNGTKASIGYNSSVLGSLGSGISGSLTAGFDHYSLVATDWSTSGAVTTTGEIQTDPSQPVSAERNVTNNTGYFAQAQLGFHDVLFLTGGLRAEQNSNLGDSLGTPLSPRVGLSYVQQVGAATLKFRGSWGRAIRAPSPNQKSRSVQPYSVNLANPLLGPERQRGVDAGVDAIFGSHGSLSFTYYDQTAENLIQYVVVNLAAVPPTYQFQNVGVVKNTGVEAEGTLVLGVLQLKGQYGYARARIDQLAPNYGGDLRVGDQTLITPKHTAGGSVSVASHTGTTVAAGLTYVGSYNQYDAVALFRCFGGTGPCQPSFRGYIAPFPSFVKVNATVSQQITQFISGFVSVDNLTNNQAPEAGNSFLAVMGRITTVGFRLHY